MSHAAGPSILDVPDSPEQPLLVEGTPEAVASIRHVELLEPEAWARRKDVLLAAAEGWTDPERVPEGLDERGFDEAVDEAEFDARAAASTQMVRLHEPNPNDPDADGLAIDEVSVTGSAGALAAARRFLEEPGECRHAPEDLMVNTTVARVDDLPPRWEIKVKVMCSECPARFELVERPAEHGGPRPRGGGPGTVFEMHPSAQAPA